MAQVVWGQAAARAAAIESELGRLAGVLRDTLGVVEVWVFGSAVTGGVHAHSDLDLLVVRDTAVPPSERGPALHRELRPRVPVDLFVYTPAELAEGGRFVRSMLREARRVL